ALYGDRGRLRFREHFEDDAIDLRLATPIVGIGVEHDFVVMTPLLEYKWASTDGIVAEVLLESADRRRADDAIPDHREVGEERSRYSLELEDDGIIVGSRVARHLPIRIFDVAVDRSGVEDRVGI